MKAMKWIKVTEKLPNIGQQVLICDNGGMIFLAELTNNGTTWIGDWFMFPTDRVSHWMPIYKPNL